jgi:hypothetical protein
MYCLCTSAATTIKNLYIRHLASFPLAITALDISLSNWFQRNGLRSRGYESKGFQSRVYIRQLLEVTAHAEYSHYLEQQSVVIVCLSLFFGWFPFLGVFASPVFYVQPKNDPARLRCSLKSRDFMCRNILGRFDRTVLYGYWFRAVNFTVRSFVPYDGAAEPIK